jgi:4-hydroxymandelate oxidase
MGAVCAGVPFAQVQGASVPGATAAAPAKPALTIDSGPRVAPLDEIVLVREFEESARLTLEDAAFSTIAETDRMGLDRITLRPRVMSPTANMDLSVELFGDKLFTPILVGPAPEQGRFHADAELGTIRGAAAARTAVIVSIRSTIPIEQVVASATTPVWCQVSAGAEAGAQIQRAVSAGVRTVCIELGSSDGSVVAKPDWAAMARLGRGVSIPVLVKGIMTPADARSALQHGIQGVIVSSRGSGDTNDPIMAVASVVDAVAGKIPVLLEGGIRVGADVVKALAFGASAVLVTRPAMWALSAYGADGVQTMIELLQNELARAMAMMGKPTPKSLTRQSLRIHAR